MMLHVYISQGCWDWDVAYKNFEKTFPTAPERHNEDIMEGAHLPSLNAGANEFDALVGCGDPERNR